MCAEIEVALQNVVVPALHAAHLPTDKPSLERLAPYMVPLPGCAPVHYLKALDLWEGWAGKVGIPTFPLVGSFVALCLLDNRHVLAGPSDLHRTAELLELYRRATAPAFTSFAARYPRASFALPQPWTAEQWARWDAYAEQAGWALAEWRAVVEIARGEAPPAAAAAAVAGAGPSPVGSPQLGAPPVQRAPSWQGPAAHPQQQVQQQQQQHQQHYRQQPQQQQQRRAAAHPQAHSQAPHAQAVVAVEQPHADPMRRAWSNPQAHAQAHAQAQWAAQAQSQLQPQPHPHQQQQQRQQQPPAHPHVQQHYPPIFYPPLPTSASRPSSSSSSTSSARPQPRASGSHGASSSGGGGMFAASGPVPAAQTTSSAPHTPVVTPQSATFPASGPVSGSSSAAPTATVLRPLGPAPAPPPGPSAASAPPPPSRPPAPPASTAPAPAPAPPPIAVPVPLPPPHFPAAPAAAPPSTSTGTSTSPGRRTAAATVDTWIAQLQDAERAGGDAARAALLAKLTGAGRAALDKVEGRKKGGGAGRASGGAAAVQQAGARKEGEPPAQGGPSAVAPPVVSASTSSALPPPPAPPPPAARTNSHPGTTSAIVQPPPVPGPLAPQPPALPAAPPFSSSNQPASTSSTPYQPYRPMPPALLPRTSTSSAPPAPHPPSSTSTSTAAQPLAPAPPERTASAPTPVLQWRSESGQRPAKAQAVAAPPLLPLRPGPAPAPPPPAPSQAASAPPPAKEKKKKKDKPAIQGRVPAVVRDAQAKQAAEDVGEQHFWHAARRADGALAACAQAKAAAEHAAQVKAAREAKLGASFGDAAETLARIRASPWTSGAATVVPPRLIVSGAGAPYGNYVPGPTMAAPPLRTLVAHVSVARDPLNALRALIRPPPPFVPTFTASPQPFPLDLSTTVHLTAPPFVTYPAALDPLTPQLADKTWAFAGDLSKHVDRIMATSAPTLLALPAPLALADADALERARKRVLASTMHDSLVRNIVGPLPDAAEPDEARRARKRVKKMRRREKKARKEREREAREGAEGGKKETEVLMLDDSGGEEGGPATVTPMDVDGVDVGEAGAAGQGGEGVSVAVEENKVRLPLSLALARSSPCVDASSRSPHRSRSRSTRRRPSRFRLPPPVLFLRSHPSPTSSARPHRLLLRRAPLQPLLLHQAHARPTTARPRPSTLRPPPARRRPSLHQRAPRSLRARPSLARSRPRSSPALVRAPTRRQCAGAPR